MQNNHLIYNISALLRQHGRPELKVKKLGDLKLKNAHSHKLFHQIELRDPLQPKHSRPVEVEVISTHELTPHTKEILQIYLHGYKNLDKYIK